MKLFCINKENLNLSTLQKLVDAGICSMIDVSLPAVSADGGAPGSEDGFVPREAESRNGRLHQAQNRGALACRAKEIVDSDYANYDCTLSGIAKKLYVSPGYLSAIFKEAMGVTFIRYLTGLRMRRAEHLLAHTELMIYEISIMAGYENPTYFSTLFKKVTGLSPKNYRLKKQSVTF